MAAAREPAVAGVFYPARVDTMDEMFKAFSQALLACPYNEVHGIVVPHAGYQYSGVTAAQGFGLVKDTRYDLIVIIGPSHAVGFRGVALDEHNAWETPLGEREVDYKPILESMTREAERIFFRSAQAHAPEHSLEVQVPFLQHFNIKGPIAPLLVGLISDEDAAAIADVLRAVASKRRTLFVVSSDLSHYLSREERLQHDKRSISIIESLDLQRSETLDACGKQPLCIMMRLCKAFGWKPTLVHESDSGDETGDTRRVVGYASMVF